jgi:hypothetical protein
MADPRNSNRASATSQKAQMDRSRIAAMADDFARAQASLSQFLPHRQYFDEDEDEDGYEGRAASKTLAAEKTYIHPIGGYEMNEREHEEYLAQTSTEIKMGWKQEKHEKYTKDDKSDEHKRSHELRRDEMQYRTTLRTAFELGLKAGLMQRSEIPPCSACERRKERNRIAAQASRVEKRRLERGEMPYTSSSSVETVSSSRLGKRRLTGGIPPPPYFSGSMAPAPSFADHATNHAAPSVQMGTTNAAAGAIYREEEDEDDDSELVPPPF